ncbi:unnamed protein product [Clavelina lepadiformis]|uniref:MaoC-like domain-containing protein n=1 Tax=Clavelina lepadiformis TaxID=159417 RepID=A0ABP0G4D1_CLALP
MLTINMLALVRRGNFSTCGRRDFANISIGDHVKAVRSFCYNDVAMFARLSGDFNPIHLDAAFAKNVFNGPIVHGALINAFISSLLGTRLPGPGTIAFSQDVRFPQPLYIDEKVQGSVVISAIKKRFIFCNISCKVPETEKVVLNGKATVMLIEKIT